MNSRERFLETARFGKPDRCFWWPEGIGAKGRWNREGMPEFKSLTESAKFFGYDYLGGGKVQTFGITMGAMPPFDKSVVEEDDRYLVYWEDAKKYQLAKDTQFKHVLEHPIKNSGDFSEMKQHYAPKLSERYPDDWNDRVSQWRQRDYPILLKLQGVFGRASSWMGYPRLCEAFYDDSSLVHEMMDFWTQHLITLLDRLMKTQVVDAVMIGELGLAHSSGPSISPATIREFMLPCYARFVEFFKGHGVDIIFLRFKGNVEHVLPPFLEVGVNGVSNLNQKSNNNVFELRRKYPDLVMMGGLSSRVLREDKDTIETEVMSKVPALLEKGGYFPCLDGGILQDVPYANFLHYVSVLQQACKSAGPQSGVSG